MTRVLLLLVLMALVGASAPAEAQLVKAESPPGTVSGRIPDGARSSPQTGKVPTRPTIARDIAVLRVLDKISARTTTLRVPVGGSAAFGLMVMTVRSCQSAPPSEAPESAAFLEIGEMDVNASVRGTAGGKGGASSGVDSFSKRLLFSGWMFASSPALSALEHPVYDVSVLACEAKQAPAVPAVKPDSASVEAGAGGAKAGEAGADEGAGVVPEPED